MISDILGHTFEISELMSQKFPSSQPQIIYVLWKPIWWMSRKHYMKSNLWVSYESSNPSDCNDTKELHQEIIVLDSAISTEVAWWVNGIWLSDCSFWVLPKISKLFPNCTSQMKRSKQYHTRKLKTCNEDTERDTTYLSPVVEVLGSYRCGIGL